MDLQIPQIQLPNGRLLGAGCPVYVIAEIGSNHDGDLERAKMLIQKAKEAGADAAKFQSYQAHTLINHTYVSNGHWEKDPSWDTLVRLSVPEEWHKQLQNEADRVGIDFLSTPFDLERLDLLINLQVPVIKIASGDLTYHELIKASGYSKRPVFLSTGHATLGEVEAALKVLWKTGCKDIVLLHCESVYPASFEDVNLQAMSTMQYGFQVLVGYSDHTPGSTVSIGAVALGACVIEKHFTDDNDREGPDHSFALNTVNFSSMVKQIRELEIALPGGAKLPRHSEKEERIMARRALYAKRKISRGESLKRDMVNIVRHCYPEGISADKWKWVVGRTVSIDIEENALITWEMV